MKLLALTWQLLRYRVAVLLWIFLLLSVALHDNLANHYWSLLLAVISLGFSYVSATSINDIADQKIDAINHPRSPGRPLINGQARNQDLWRVFALACVGALGFALMISFKAAVVIAISILVNIFYSLRPVRLSYRTFLAPLALGVAYVGIPYILGLIISSATDQVNDWAWAIALYFIFIGRIILKDFRDRAGDKAYKKPTFLLCYGKSATCVVSTLFILAGGLILIWQVHNHWWLAVFCGAYLLAILWVLNKLKTVSMGQQEQIYIGIGAKIGNGLLISLVGIYALKQAGASESEQILFASLIAALFAINFIEFWRQPQKIILGYKG